MNSNIKQKRAELLDEISKSLKGLQHDVTDIKQDISQMKKEFFLLRTVKEIKSETIKQDEPPTPSISWWWS